MLRRNANSPAAQIRRAGIRVAAGQLTLFVSSNPKQDGRLIVALGRTAGTAVTRARVRRLARDMYAGNQGVAGAQVLLLARGDLNHEPRKRIREILGGLFVRGHAVLNR